MLITEPKHCTGCGVCSSLCPKEAINMTLDKEGHIIPQINADLCIKCQKCVNMCTENCLDEPKNSIVYSLIAQTKNESIVNSTSGGFATEVARHIVSSGGVYYGVTFREGIAEYIEIRCIEDVKLTQGSKYIQAFPNDVHNRVLLSLKENKEVLFVGRPCDVAALNNYLIKKTSREWKNLTTIDFICWGVGSYHVFNDFVNSLSENKFGERSKICHINFRDKSEGYTNSQLKIEFEKGDYRTEHGAYSLGFGFGFAAHLLSRQVCDHCKYASLNRYSDFTVGDWTSLENNLDDSEKGVSLVLISSEKGKMVFDKIASELICKRVDIEEIIVRLPRLTNGNMINRRRKKFFKDYKKKGYGFVEGKYLCPQKVSIISQIAHYVYFMPRKLKKIIKISK